MTTMNFKAALKAAKSVGYDGADTLPALKAWQKEWGAITDLDGKAVDIVITADEEDVSVAKSRRGKATEPDDEDTKSEREDDEDMKSAIDAAVAKALEAERIKGARANGSRTTGVDADVDTKAHWSPAQHRIHAERKAYDNAAAAGRPIPLAFSKGGMALPAFPSADAAERFGAMARLQLANDFSKARNYSQRSNDEAILGLKAGSSFQHSLGGAWIPEEFGGTFIQLALEYGVFRFVVGSTPTNGRPLTIPRDLSDPTVTWEGESDEIAETDLTTGSIELNTRKMAAIIRQPIELLETSALSIADAIARNLTRAAEKKLDQAGFLGDGTAAYGNHLGIIPKLKGIGTNPEDGKGVILAAGDNHDDITKDNIDALRGALPFEWMGGAEVFICHQTFFYGVMKPLIDTASTGMSRVEFQGRTVPAWDGVPVIFSHIMPAYVAGSSATSERDTIPLLYGNFARGAKMPEWSAMTALDTTDQRYWERDQIGFKLRRHVGVNVHDVGTETVAGPIGGLIMEDA